MYTTSTRATSPTAAEADTDRHRAAGLEVSCRHCALYRLCLPAQLPAHEVRILEGAIERCRELPAGTSLVRAGSRMQALYAIRSGSARSYSLTLDGEERVRGFHLPGEIVGLEAFAQDRHLCEVVALEPLTYCRLPVRRLERLMDTLPGLRREIMRLLSQGLEEAQQQRAGFAATDARQRVAGFLVDLSRRLERRELAATRFRLSMSRRDIASYLGLTLETVSRALGTFKRNGWIDIHLRHVTLLRPDSLAALCSAP